jgi:hypothetical protein
MNNVGKYLLLPTLLHNWRSNFTNPLTIQGFECCRSPVSNRHKLKILKLDPTRQVPIRLQASTRVSQLTKLINCQIASVLTLEVVTRSSIPDYIPNFKSARTIGIGQWGIFIVSIGAIRW